MIIFHIAEKRRWDAAKLAGSYAWSTVGRSLEDEGFIHASREDQWRTVRDTFYADVSEPLVLLVIDTDRLTSAWREDQVGYQSFPHIYGPLNPAAVIEERPVSETPAASAGSPVAGSAAGQVPTSSPAPVRPQSFLQLFVGEFVFRISVAVAVMALSAILGFTAAGIWGDQAALWGLLVGLLIGIPMALAVFRRRNERLKRPATSR